MLTALGAGLSFAHLLELPPGVFYFDAKLWVATTTKGSYALFGTVGAVVEVGSILTAVIKIAALSSLVLSVSVETSDESHFELPTGSLRSRAA